MGGLGVIRLKYVYAFRDRMGRMCYYFRRHGRRTTLPGLPGANEFMAVYAAQLEGTSKQVEPRPKAAPGTFSALAIRYYGSPQYQSLSATSRSNYRRIIDGFLARVSWSPSGRPNDPRARRYHYREDGEQTGRRDHFVEAHPDIGALRDSPGVDRP